jgi:hypothetical protein
MPDSHVKISGRSDYHTLQNLSSNTIENKESEMSRIPKSFGNIIYLEIFLRCQKLPNTQRFVIFLKIFFLENAILLENCPLWARILKSQKVFVHFRKAMDQGFFYKISIDLFNHIANEKSSFENAQ